MKELDHIVNRYPTIAGIMSPIFTCDESREIMWRCFAEGFEALERSFLDVMKGIRRTIPEWECPRVVQDAKEEADIELLEDFEEGVDTESVEELKRRGKDLEMRVEWIKEAEVEVEKIAKGLGKTLVLTTLVIKVEEIRRWLASF